MIIERRKDDKIIFLFNRPDDLKDRSYLVPLYAKEYQDKQPQNKVLVTVSIVTNEIIEAEDGAGRFL